MPQPSPWPGIPRQAPLCQRCYVKAGRALVVPHDRALEMLRRLRRDAPMHADCRQLTAPDRPLASRNDISDVSHDAFAIGDRVVVHGLSTATQFNGAMGTCEAFDSGAGRLTIRTDTDDLLNVRFDCLALLVGDLPRPPES